MSTTGIVLVAGTRFRRDYREVQSGTTGPIGPTDVHNDVVSITRVPG